MTQWPFFVAFRGDFFYYVSDLRNYGIKVYKWMKFSLIMQLNMERNLR